MEPTQIVLEGIGVNSINTKIMFIMEQINVLLGERGGKTRYKVSLLNFSSDTKFNEIMDEVAESVDWNTSVLRYADKDSERRRYIYMVACTVKDMAVKLRDIAAERAKYDSVYKDALKAFSMLCNFHNDMGQHNPFAKAGYEFGYVMKESVDVYVPTRLGTSISEDVSASYEVNRLYDNIATQISGAIDVVQSILDAVGASGSEDAICNAAKFMLAYVVVKQRFFGPEDVSRDLYEPNNLAKYMFNIIDTGWSQKSTSERILEDNSDELDDLDDEELKKMSEKKRADFIKTHTNVVKEMDRLGANTDQLNYLSDNTKFTSATYYKIFAINPLSGVPYKTTPDKLVYKILNLITRKANVGFGADNLDNRNASEFALYIKELFAGLARDTEKALSVRASLINALDDVIEYSKTDFEKLYSRFQLGTVQKDSKKHLNSAISFIQTDVLYIGSGSVNNKVTGNGKPIAAGRLTSPVYTFGDMNTTERNTTMDLTKAGAEVSKMFSFYDNTLHVEYSGNLVDTNIQSDAIPGTKIKDVYGDYVSSSLLPANVSKSKAWIMLSGILAFSRVDHGTLSDTKGISPVTQKAADLIMASNIKNSTRADKQASVDSRLSNPEMLKLLGRYRFMDSDTVHNSVFRNRLIDRVSTYTVLDPNIGQKVTDVRAVCDRYMTVISDYARSFDSNEKVITSELYNVSPKLLELVNGKEAAVDKIMSRYLSDTNESSGLVTAISNTSTALSVLKASTGNTSKNAAFLIFNASMEYVTRLNILGRAIRKYVRADQKYQLIRDGKDTEQSELEKLFDAMTPEQFGDINSILDSINESLNATKDIKKKLQIVNENSEKIRESANLLVSAGQSGIASLNTNANELVHGLIDSSDNKEKLTKLYNGLMDVVDLIKQKNVTFRTVHDVQKAIASAMYGDEADNMRALQSRNINQLVGPVKVMKTLMNISGITKPDTDEDQADAIDVNYDIHDEESIGLDELHPMSGANKGKSEYNRILRDIDRDIYSASTYDDIPFEGKYIETALRLTDSYIKDMADLDSLGDELDAFADMVSDELGIVLDENDKITDALAKIIDADSIDPSIRSYAEKCLKKHNLLKPRLVHDKDAIDQFQKMYPSVGGVVTAIINGRITVDEVRYALHELDVANEIIGNLTKYNSADNEDDDRRLYAYTKSDEDTIAQIIHVLGRYVTEPYDGTANEVLSELVGAFETISSVVTRYSGNPLSVKMVNKVLSDIKSTEGDDNGESTAATVIKDINSLGRVLLSRISHEADTELLKNINKIDEPSEHSESYGKAMDAFAKSVMRAKEPTSIGQIKSAGKVDKAESEARKQFAKYIISDVTENIELSKYAYMLGRAFDSYDRLMRDERVSEDRSYNSILDSFEGVKLWGDLGDNDLQRELVSAIIDDERKGDKSYPTVQQVVDAAKTGSPFQSYGSMYSTKIGDPSSILNDEKNIQVAFDNDGNIVDDHNNAVALDMTRISKLAVPNSDAVYDNVTDLVHGIRMYVCEKITRTYGKLDEIGNVELVNKTSKQADALLSEALKSLYRLCDNMETPLADIITVTDTIGHKAGRLKVMSYVKQSLEDNTDIDLDTLGMVSDEPDAYPQMMSDKTSGPDVDWINNITTLLSQIPESLNVDELLDGVDKYCSNQIGKEEMSADPALGKVLSIIEQLTKVETSTGIPTGFWGNDSTQKKDAIRSIFNKLASEPGDNWEQRAASLRYDMMTRQEAGRNKLSVGSASPSNIAAKRIAHMRMNPYYAVKAYSTNSDEYKLMVRAISDIGLVKKIGARVTLAIPGCVFDSNSFNYLMMMAINMAKNTRYRFTREDAFLNALMCYKSGVRMPSYIELMDRTYGYISSDDKEVRNAIHNAEKIIKTKFNAEDYNTFGMVKDDNGLFTYYAYLVLCTYARFSNPDVSEPGDIIANFLDGLDLITSAGNTVFDLTSATKNSGATPSVTSEDGDGETVSVDDENAPVKSKPSKSKGKRKTSKVAEPRPETVPASYTMEDDDGTELNIYASGASEPSNPTPVSDNDEGNNDAEGDEMTSALYDIFSDIIPKRSHKKAKKENTPPTDDTVSEESMYDAF